MNSSEDMRKKRNLNSPRYKTYSATDLWDDYKQCYSPWVKNLCYLRKLFNDFILRYMGNVFHTQLICITNFECWYVIMELFIIWLAFNIFKILKCFCILFGKNLSVLWRFWRWNCLVIRLWAQLTFRKFTVSMSSGKPHISWSCSAVSNIWRWSGVW